jgi:hypothetical protein
MRMFVLEDLEWNTDWVQSARPGQASSIVLHRTHRADPASLLCSAAAEACRRAAAAEHYVSVQVWFMWVPVHAPSTTVLHNS